MYNPVLAVPFRGTDSKTVSINALICKLIDTTHMSAAVNDARLVVLPCACVCVCVVVLQVMARRGER